MGIDCSVGHFNLLETKCDSKQLLEDANKVGRRKDVRVQLRGTYWKYWKRSEDYVFSDLSEENYRKLTRCLFVSRIPKSPEASETIQYREALGCLKNTIKDARDDKSKQFEAFADFIFGFLKP